MVKRYVTSIRQLPGGRYERAVYKAWNEGDIAHTLDNKPVDANPYSPETHGLLWRTWRRGWEGHSMDIGVAAPPSPKSPVRVMPLIVVKSPLLRKIKVRLRALLKGRLHVPHHDHVPEHQTECE